MPTFKSQAGLRAREREISPERRLPVLTHSGCMPFLLYQTRLPLRGQRRNGSMNERTGFPFNPAGAYRRDT